MPKIIPALIAPRTHILDDQHSECLLQLLDQALEEEYMVAWVSTNSTRALAVAKAKERNHRKHMVVVQAMVESDIAGLVDLLSTPMGPDITRPVLVLIEHMDLVGYWPSVGTPLLIAFTTANPQKRYERAHRINLVG